MTKFIVIKAEYDPEVAVWYTESSDVHGPRIEAPTFNSLAARVPLALQDLLECDGPSAGYDIPIKVVAQLNTPVRSPGRA